LELETEQGIISNGVNLRAEFNATTGLREEAKLNEEIDHINVCGNFLQFHVHLVHGSR
jgi:hypothetical protein